MFDFRRGISSIILVLALAGCSEGTESIDLRVGLFVAGEDSLSARLRYDTGSKKESEFRGLDKSLESAITKACRRTFSSVHVLESDPTQVTTNNGDLDLIVIATLLGSGGSFGYQGPPIWNRGESEQSFSVQLTFYTREMKQVSSVKASGKGSAESIGILFAAEKRALVKSVKAAIRNLGDDLVRQVRDNPDIRNMAERNGK
ncbi:MAG: hypothetical protein OXN17_17160 [Candidatus Poribacteria bacterium]|nr:hypothetical protein [Candidatus Poribacteria bacterium]MDE0502946.1 hypothetical protein [Candidatus Poribacteria bacterium]